VPALQKLRSIPVCFNPDRYWPGQPKDLRLVLRAGAALRTKDHQLFIRLAQKCPEHRFVLAAVRTSGSMGALEEAIEYNRSLGNPVDLRVAVQPEEMAELTRRAGIYLHTHAPDSRYGMPISICEAMATGGYVIGRRCPASVAYIGNPAQCYDDEDGAARLVNETLTWTPEQWRQKQLEAVDRAYRFHADTIVLRPILEEWLRLAAERSGETIRQAA
jgi:hypothetical protein